MKTNLYKYITFFFLMLAVQLFAFLYERFQLVGNEFLKNQNFAHGIASWMISGPEGSIGTDSSGGIVLFSADPNENIILSQMVFNVEGGSLLKVTGELKTINIIPENRKINWHRARLHISNYDKQGAWLSGAVVIVALEGDNSWKKYSKTIKVNSGAKQVRIAAQLLHCTGTFMIRTLSLHQVVEKPAYPYMRIIFIFLMALYIFWLSAPYVLNHRGLTLKIMVFVLSISILFGVFLPKNMLIEQILNDTYGSNQELNAPSLSQEKVHGKRMVIEDSRVIKRMKYISKAGHFVLFLWLGLCLAALSVRRNKKYLIMDIICFAGITELIQIFVEGRTPLLKDCFLDVSGGFLGILLFLVLRQIWISHKL